MHGIGLEQDVRSWFDDRVPKPRVGRNVIAKALGAHYGWACAFATTPRRQRTACA